tara:strand:+ start:149 stop:466 length:318 start_codon:yes stop_codon:yes gene_type:complete
MRDLSGVVELTVLRVHIMRWFDMSFFSNDPAASSRIGRLVQAAAVPSHTTQAGYGVPGARNKHNVKVCVSYNVVAMRWETCGVWNDADAGKLPCPADGSFYHRGY